MVEWKRTSIFFGSLAILAAYRNWRLIVLASAITAADHVFRGLYFPASIYGLTFASSWRAMEHIGWVAFEDVFLLVNIRSILGLSHNIAVQQADLEFALSLEENKRIRESLRSEKLLHLMMNSIPSMVGYLGIDNKYQFMNQSYQQVFGNATQEMQEGDIARVLGAESATFVLEQRARAFRGNNVHFELQFNLAGGELKVLDAHYIPDIDANGKVQGLIVLCTDLTERTSAQKLIEQQRAHIVTASKFSALGEMAGNVAHEINTPLAIIQLLSDKMTAQIESEGIVPADLIQTAETISNTVTRIAKIIAGMRSLSRTTDQDAMVETKIASIIGDTLALCSEKFKNHGVRLSVNCSTDALVECRGVQIAQVLLNILNNAYDAIEDQEQKWVELQVEDLDSFVRVRITDSGLRMSAEVQRKVFLPFFTTKELGRGTGIGLSVSQSIIDSHGGSLLIDPHSITTSFVIDLPKKHANSKGSSGSRLKIAG